MSISGILSSSFSNPYQQSLSQLHRDLKSGDVSAAQSGFTTLQKAFSQPATVSSFASNPVSQAFNQLANDLKSGNVSAAQQDLSAVQRELKTAGDPASTHAFNHRHSISTGGGT